MRALVAATRSSKSRNVAKVKSFDDVAASDTMSAPVSLRVLRFMMAELATITVSSPNVKEPKFVRYAWQANPLATLFNGAGLPAVPFRTDE